MKGAVYTIQLSVNNEGFWLSEMVVYGPKGPTRFYGEVTDNPGEAVTTLLQKAGVETVTGAKVLSVGKS